jgi:hypothetical protein
MFFEVRASRFRLKNQDDRQHGVDQLRCDQNINQSMPAKESSQSSNQLPVPPPVLLNKQKGSAILFPRISGEGVFQQPRLFASTINSPSQVRIVSNCEQSHHGCQAYKVTEGGVGSIKDLG